MIIDVTEELAGQRLDVVVARHTGLGRAMVKRMIANGRVELTRDDKRLPPTKGQALEVGMRVAVAHDGEKAAAPDYGLKLTVVLETDHVVIVDKPAGIASAPLEPSEKGTIANALVARYPEMKAIGYSAREPGLCQRLDVGTSGLLLAARTGPAFAELTTAIRSGRFDKRYLLACRPSVPLPDRIEAPIDVAGKRVRVHPSGRASRTELEVVFSRGDGMTLVEASASPATRHQIRVHLASVGAPLVGDATYGGETGLLRDRHALHASRLSYDGGKVVEPFDIRSVWPTDLRHIVTEPPVAPR